MSSIDPRPRGTRRASPIPDHRRDDQARAAKHPHGMIAMINASVIRSTIAGLLLFAAACAPAAAAAASPTPGMSQFDGSYRGTLTLVVGGTSTTYFGSSPTCEENKTQQVMSVSGNQVYLERKSAFQVAPLLLAGTVSPDGSVSAAGVTRSELFGHQSLFFTLTGKIENNEFKGELNSRECEYSISLKR